MKVLQLIQKPQLRGAEIFACQLSEQLNQKGVETSIVPIFDGAVQLPYKGTIINLSANQSKRIIDIKGWRKLAALVKKERPDIIQANAGDTLKYAVCSKLLFGWKTPIVFRNASTISRYIKSSFARKWNGWLFKNTSLVVSVSKTSMLDLVQLFPEVSNRIKVISIGVEEQELPDKTRNDQFTLVHVGGFSFEKNHERLLHVFKNIVKQHPKAILWLIGDGPLKSKIELLAKELGLDKSIIFYGAQANAMKFIRQADVLVLPSIIEGLPAVILEAFYVKTPVVTYDVGGIKEVVTKDTGWIVDKNDEDGFLRAVNEVIDNPHNVSSKVETAYNIVTEGYLNRVIADKFCEVYKELVKA